MEERIEVEPNPEPAREPFDAHVGPLDDDEDARWLLTEDPRRVEVERRRGSGFLQRLGERIRHRRED